MQIACRQGWLDYPENCSICGHSGSLHYHTENYFRPLVAFPICRACHYRLHRRFLDPHRWLARLHQEKAAASWAASITMTELTREAAMALARQPDPVSCEALPGPV
jgi:hypothetical protein